MALSTTITRAYWLMKMEDVERDGFFWEYKSCTDHWSKRFLTALNEFILTGCESIPGNYLIGSESKRTDVIGFMIMQAKDVPDRYRAAVSTDIALAWKNVPKGGL